MCTRIQRLNGLGRVKCVELLGNPKGQSAAKPIKGGPTTIPFGSKGKRLEAAHNEDIVYSLWKHKAVHGRTWVNQRNTQNIKKTAADTEEISIAMSKVASIANSTGMSLENTAGFLTQIIATTREAPETA